MVTDRRTQKASWILTNWASKSQDRVRLLQLFSAECENDPEGTKKMIDDVIAAFNEKP